MVFHSSTIAMMHGPINIRCFNSLYFVVSKQNVLWMMKTKGLERKRLGHARKTVAAFIRKYW